MSESVERFAALPDSYVFDADDGLMVAAVAPHGQVSYGTRDGELLFIKAFEANVRTAGDLRQLLAANPRSEQAEQENAWAKLGAQLGLRFDAILVNLALQEVQDRALRDLLFSKGVITREEWSSAYATELRRSFWGMRDRIFFDNEEQVERYKVVYAGFLAAEEERAKLFPPSREDEFPQPPENRNSIFETHKP